MVFPTELTVVFTTVAGTRGTDLPCTDERTTEDRALPGCLDITHWRSDSRNVVVDVAVELGSGTAELRSRDPRQ